MRSWNVFALKQNFIELDACSHGAQRRLASLVLKEGFFWGKEEGLYHIRGSKNTFETSQLVAKDVAREFLQYFDRVDLQKIILWIFTHWLPCQCYIFSKTTINSLQFRCILKFSQKMHFFTKTGGYSTLNDPLEIMHLHLHIHLSKYWAGPHSSIWRCCGAVV